jgi:hypothetical protein
MYRCIYFLAAFLAVAPLRAFPAPVPESEVGEPDSMPIPESPESNEFSLEPGPEKPAEKTQPPMPQKPQGEMEGGFNTVILRGLNKVTARASTIETIIGSTVRFGTLEIIAKSCWKSAPEDRPENAALLEINEIKQGEPPSKIFLGWMFSSSPGLSSLENPFYDITVVKCGKSEGGKL